MTSRHKWHKTTSRRHYCEKCGCRKERLVYSVKYTTLDGTVSKTAPECKNSTNMEKELNDDTRT